MPLKQDLIAVTLQQMVVFLVSKLPKVTGKVIIIILWNMLCAIALVVAPMKYLPAKVG